MEPRGPAHKGLLVLAAALAAGGGLALAEETEARSAEATFETEEDTGGWEGGALADGVLGLSSEAASLALLEGPDEAVTALEARFLVRQRDAAALALHLDDAEGGRATWSADFAPGGGLSLTAPDGEISSRLHLPHGHRAWTTESEPALEGDPATYWEAGSLLHCDVHRDEASGTWHLYYTGVMSPGYGYRQIGLATSTDGSTWTKDPSSPLITIDYDTTTVDGIHAHMPSVVVDSSGTWHMYYACYQNSVGNRICHATSTDGQTWTRPAYGAGRVALDLGSSGSFDDASLREPDVSIAADGTFYMTYVGTQADQHYGPAGLARSTDGGWTWERVARISEAESELQGGSILQTAYGLEQWYQCGPYICFAESLPAGAAEGEGWSGELDWTEWTMDTDPVLSPGWADWNQSYIQAPTVWLVDDTTLHMWFNANNYATNIEVLGHAWTTPLPDTWATVELGWDGAVATVSLDGGPPLEAPLSSLIGLSLSTGGEAELDEVAVAWTVALAEAEDTAAPEDTGEDTDEPPEDTGPADEDEEEQPQAPAEDDGAEAGCKGCATSARSATGWGVWLAAGLLLLGRRRLQAA